MYKNTICYILLSLLFISPEAAHASASQEKLERLQTTFVSELAKIRKTYDKKNETLKSSYIESVTALQKKKQSEGELQPLLAIKKELDRFKITGDITDEALVKNVKSLYEIQLAYIRECKNIAPEEAEQIVKLSKFYDRSLEKMQKDLTRKGQLEDAVAVKNERDSLWQMSVVKKAQDLSASAEAASDNTKPTAQQPEPQKPVEPVAKPSFAKTLSRAERSKIEIYIKKRYEEFCDVVIDRDLESACKFVDPVFLENNGKNAVKMRLQWICPFLRAADQKNIKLAVDEIDLSEDVSSARLTPKMWVNNNWHNLPPNTWIKVENEWYIKVDGGQGRPNTGDQQQPQHQGQDDNRRPFKKYPPSGDRRPPWKR